MYIDVAGRINSEHITPEEWALLEKAYRLNKWFVPNDDDWLAARGLLAMLDIRRGYKWKTRYDIQLGTANLRINAQGRAALRAHWSGNLYTNGLPLSEDAIQTLLDDEQAVWEDGA